MSRQSVFGPVPVLVALVVLLLISPSAGFAQTLSPDSVRGRVVKDGQPVPDAVIALHRVTPDSSGSIASARSGPEGEFAFALESLPEAQFNVFFVTAEYQSVRYFGDPIHLADPSAEYRVAVFDTASSLATPVRVNRRDMVLLPQADDAWEVNEIISIENDSNRALVSTGGLPTLEISIPSEATDFLAGEGAGIFPHEVTFMDHRVLLITPVTPGVRDMWIRYRLPARPAAGSIPIDQPTDTFNLYVQQPSHLTAVEGLSTAQMIDVDDEQFLQYSGLDLPVGSAIELRWSGGLPIDPVMLAVGITLALLAAGAFLAVRNRSAAYG